MDFFKINEQYRDSGQFLLQVLIIMYKLSEIRISGGDVDISIPGYGDLKIENIVLDYNGTLASGGRIIEESVPMLKKLSADYRLFVITADTFGTVERELQGIDCRLHIIGRDNQARQKEEFVETLGADITAAMGNGRNDILMLKRAALGIGVIGHEGAFTETVRASDITVYSITHGLNLFLCTESLIATLRG